jgi:excisionase family DNA binding protein
MCKATITTEQAKNLPAIIYTADVSRLTGKNLRTIQAMAKSGQLPAVRLGHQWAFNTAKLLALLGID